MGTQSLPDNFYEKVKPRLHRRIGRELRLARRVLDFGCGPCELVEYLADAYHQKIAGVDVSSGSFPAHRRSRSGRRFRCIRQDAARLSAVAEESVDAVVTVCALHEMDRPDAILAKAREVLRPGGEILAVDFPRGSLAQRLWNEDYYSPGEVERMMTQAGFTDVRVRTIERGQLIWATGYRPSGDGRKE